MHSLNLEQVISVLKIALANLYTFTFSFSTPTYINMILDPECNNLPRNVDMQGTFGK